MVITLLDDESAKVKRSLKDGGLKPSSKVRHVPKLNRNIICWEVLINVAIHAEVNY